MSPTQDKPKSYMQQLDEWIEATVITPLVDPLNIPPSEDFEQTIQTVKKAIQEKVLESYHNGQATSGPRAYKRSNGLRR